VGAADGLRQRRGALLEREPLACRDRERALIGQPRPPSRHRELSFFSMTAVIGAPKDITVGEVALESFYPADQTTAEALRELAAAGGGRG
jgi:hypothetical protein